jgi:phosphoribosyl 1,2-cyclic phosphodiesterase
MRVTFWGVRGSIATPGPATVRYGGNTVCVEVRTSDGSLIILDAGTGVRELGDKMMREGERPEAIHLFVTHPHWDHIMGAPFFAPIYDKRTHLVIHALSPRAHRSVEKMILFDGEHFPVLASQIPAKVDRGPDLTDSARVGSATITRISLNHPGGADGFRIDDDDGSSMCYLTDNELDPPGQVTTTPAALAKFAYGAGLLVHDAQYLPQDMPAKRGWGHSVIDQVLALGKTAEARVLALHHHDPSRDDAALDRIGDEAVQWTREHAPAMQTIVAAEGLTIDVESTKR